MLVAIAVSSERVDRGVRKGNVGMPYDNNRILDSGSFFMVL